MTKCQFAFLGCITVAKDLPSVYTVTAAHDRAQVDTSTLVGAQELRQHVALAVIFKRNQLFFFGTIVTNDDFVGIYVFYDTVAFGVDQHAGVSRHFTFQTGTYNRRAWADQRHCLTLHVGAHQGTVSVIVFKERNQRSRHTYNLIRCNVHEFQFIWRQYREITMFP